MVCDECELAGALAALLGVPRVVVTLAASGCVAWSANASHSYPAHEAVAVDTTGAGDAFAATLAAHLVARAAPPGAVHAAQVAAVRAIWRLRIHAGVLVYHVH